MIAFAQSISASFILWAIIRLFIEIRRSKTLKELVKQKFIILHFVTLLVYLTSLITYYVYFTIWEKNTVDENQVFISFALSTFLFFCVQISLIFLFLNLSRPDDGVPDLEISSKDQLVSRNERSLSQHN